jgi:hypothetical protein
MISIFAPSPDDGLHRCVLTDPSLFYLLHSFVYDLLALDE